MGWLSSLVGGSVVEPIAAIGSVLDNLITTDEERAAADLLKSKLAQQPQMAQAEINKVQAQHRSTFVAGARPFLMWVCGLGFLFAFVINPILQWLAPHLGAPELPLDAMLELTLAMLGLAGLRTAEKIKGVAKKFPQAAPLTTYLCGLFSASLLSASVTHSANFWPLAALTHLAFSVGVQRMVSTDDLVTSLLALVFPVLPCV